jgi:hypothetical protein
MSKNARQLPYDLNLKGKMGPNLEANFIVVHV